MTPRQNVVAKRRNRVLLHMVRSMVAQTNPFISYWGDALLTTSHVLNQVPLKFVSYTPNELWDN